jgi:acyl-coenzyme A synthetase/AMP-(fatty) acid ligase
VGFLFAAALLGTAAARVVGVLYAPQWTAQECARVHNLSTPRFSLLPAERTMPNDPERTPVAIGDTEIGLITHPNEAEPCEPDDAMLIYTSGTSAIPKGVVLTRKNFDANIRGINEYLALTAEDRSPVFTPTAYAYAVSQALTHALAGAAVYPIPEGMVQPQSVTRAIESDRLTGLAANPTVFKAILSSQTMVRHDLSSLRFVMSAGQFLEWDLVAQLEAACPNAQIINTYGCTENSPRIAYLPLARGTREPGAYVPVGYPVRGTTIRILDELDRPLPAGQVGGVVIGGRARMRGYWQNDRANQERLVDGEFRTGDHGMIDVQGRLHLVGRESNVIHVSHNKVSPEEVEAVLLSHPAVKQAAVFGEPDALREEIVAAKVVLSAEQMVTADELVRYCMERLSRLKIPRKIYLVSTLPHTMYGKIDRSRLRETELQPI